jgi:hypothetical protein
LYNWVVRNHFLVLLTAVLVVGCSEAPKAAKKAAEPLKPLTGREAFQQMYPQARAWAPDAQPLQIKSVRLQDVKADPGRSGAWQVMFVSPGRNKAKTFTWSAIESEGNLHQGVFGGPEDSWSGSGQAKPFAVQAVKVDTDDAYTTAAKKSDDYLKKNPDKPVIFIAEFTPRFPDTTWRVVWGDSVVTSDYSVYIDATTGQFLEKMH